jgi:hypothetical protein
MIRWREERQRREEGNLAEERWIEILFLEFLIFEAAGAGLDDGAGRAWEEGKASAYGM